ncbi:hypothetical protein [Rhodoferax sp.]|uniref:hypothetical protein n=1 Tax=Rhodoferax sp. TaxID=50421 RepID=UPI0025D1F6D4|nr:hypothetical protein [Rhodoferax sp.]
MNSFGNLVTNLFALALGLGSLKLAGEGLWAGAIGGIGSSAADVRFTAHPLGFVLLVAAWTAFGVFLVGFGWRGFTRPGDADGDDEEDIGGEVPAPRPRSLPIPRPPTGMQAAPPPPVAAPATARPAARLPEPLELYTARMWAVCVLVLTTLVILGAAYACIGLSYFLTEKGAAILFAPGLVGYLVVAWKCVRDFFWRGPALVLDRFGILDYRQGGRSIPWTDVDAVRLHASSNRTSLVLRFRDLALPRQHFGALSMLGAWMNRIFYKGYEGRVVLTGLRFQRAQVLQVAQTFVRHARR